VIVISNHVYNMYGIGADEAGQLTTPDAVYNLPVNIASPASTQNKSLDSQLSVSPTSISTATSPELASHSAITSGIGETTSNTRQSNATRTYKRNRASLPGADQNFEQKKKPKIPSKSKIWRDKTDDEINDMWVLVENINNEDNKLKIEVTGRLAILQHYGNDPHPCKSYPLFEYLQELEKTSAANTVTLEEDRDRQRTHKKKKYFNNLKELKKNKEELLKRRRELVEVLDKNIKAIDQASTFK